jgi:hypothetical protein
MEVPVVVIRERRLRFERAAPAATGGFASERVILYYKLFSVWKSGAKNAALGASEVGQPS